VRIRFNPTGTHIHKDFLKVRLDLHPDPTDKTYAMHYIQVPVFPPEGYQGRVDEMGNPVDQRHYDRWVSRLPKIWQLNPCLCHFIVVPEMVGLRDISAFIPQIFDKGTLATLDDALIRPDAIHYVSPFMRNKAILERKLVTARDTEDLIGSVNQRLGSIALSLGSGGEITPIEPQSIDVGNEAEGRDTNAGGYFSVLDTGNSANASGTIDTVETWASAELSNADFAILYFVSGSTFHSRDNEDIGTIASGSKQTFSSLSLDIETGDHIGAYFTGNGMEMDSDGGSGTVWRDVGNSVTKDNEEAWGYSYANYALSLKGTGAEAGGGWANIASLRQGTGEIASGDIANIRMGTGSIAVADIAKIGGVAV